MLDSIKHTANTVVEVSTNVASSLVSTAKAFPGTVSRARHSPKLRFFIDNSLLIDWMQFALPLLSVHYLTQSLQNDDEDNFTRQTNAFISKTMVNALFFMLYFRLSTRNMLLHTIATTTGNTLLQDEYKSERLIHDPSRCKDCRFDGDRFKTEASFILHYFVGSGVVFGTTLALDYLPVVGPAMAYLLDAYWRGFVAFEYPLASKLCAKHQIAVLSDNKAPLLALGLFLNGLEKSLSLPISVVTSDPKTIKILSTGIQHTLARLGMIHAYTMSPSLQMRSEVSPTISWDPVYLSWLLSIELTAMTTAHLKKAITLDGHTTSLWEYSSQYFELYKNRFFSSSWFPLYQVLGTLFLPSQARSMKAFTETEALKPFIELVINDLAPLLKTATQINDQVATKALLSLIRFPVLGRVLISAGAQYTNSQTGLSREFIKAFALWLQDKDVAGYLKAMDEHVNRYKKDAIPVKKFGCYIQETGIRFFEKKKVTIQEDYVSVREEKEDEAKSTLALKAPLVIKDNHFSESVSAEDGQAPTNYGTLLSTLGFHMIHEEDIQEPKQPPSPLSNEWVNL